MAAAMQRTSVRGIFRKGNRYVVVYRHRGQQRKRSFRTLADARQGKAEITADIGRGEYRQTAQSTFGEYAREWIETYQGRTTRGFRESTRVGYRRTIEDKAIPFFDARTARLAEIEPRDIRAFIAWLFDERKQERKLAVSTVRNHVAAVRALFATAAEDGAIRHNPVAGVRISRPGVAMEADPAKQRRALERKELVRFLDAAPADWRLFFELLAHTGLRISEAMELRWSDVDLGAKRLRVRREIYRGVIDTPKSEHGKRDVPLSTSMGRALWQRQESPDALVFTDRLGRQLTYHYVEHNVLKPTRAASGLEWATLHTLRHTCASLLFAAGKNIKQVQEWLGHSDPGFTLRTYVHLIDDGLGDADFFDEVTVARTRRDSAPGSATAAAV